MASRWSIGLSSAAILLATVSGAAAQDVYKIGMAAGLTESTAGLGAVGGYKDLARFTTLGGTLFVFGLPET